MKLKKILIILSLFFISINSENKTYDQLKKILEQEAENKFKISKPKSTWEIDFKKWSQIDVSYRKTIREQWESVLHEIKHFVDAYEDFNSDALKCYFYLEGNCDNNQFEDKILPTIFDLNKSLFKLITKFSEAYLNNSPQFYKILSEKTQNLKSLINNLKIIIKGLKATNIKPGARVWFKGDHEAKAIILDTLNIYEKIVQKISLYYSPTKEQLKHDINNTFENLFLDPKISFSNNISQVSQDRLNNLLSELLIFINNSESKDIPKLFEDNYGLSPLTLSLIDTINIGNNKSLEDKNKILRNIDSLESKFNSLSNSLNSVFTLRQGPKEAKEVFRLFLDKIFQVLNKLKLTYNLYQPSILMNLIVASSLNFGLSNKDFSEFSNAKHYDLKEFSLKNFSNLNKDKLENFTNSLRNITNFISDFMLGKNPYICFVRYYEQDKCKLSNGNGKQITIWDLYEDLLSFINKTKVLLTLTDFKRDETEFKSKLNKFENALKTVKNNNTQYEKESKILLDYVVKIYKKVADKLKADFNF